ncbi:protein lin-54 homolog isoform X2 [Onthophagus taurus]|uniref:protein lin-54 homolog isoform X2 n=1 Tax=Onthophagus taurus TaxID=166361 RepID=UPI000C20D9A0|nr:protein lin-54 homolog isoform X2 [Onthophagus taurus]
MENASLQETNLTSLSSSELEQFAELSQNLNISSDIDNQASEEEMSMVHIEEAEEEELVQTDLGAQEIEIEMEPDNAEEILPDVKPKSVPPLRPLSIAPKPTKMPYAIKPVAGQQLLLVQGNGQQFKILSPQTINLSNVQLGKPLAIKPTIKSVTQGSTTPKQVVMKKLQPVSKPGQLKTYDNKQIVVVQKSDVQPKVVTQVSTSISTPTKTITLAQAQQMGLLPNTKLVPQTAGATTKHAILLNKPQQKGLRLVRTPAKILPAPSAQVNTVVKQPQRILLKSTSSPTLIAPNQLIQVGGNQPISAGQIHQINIPGKGVQYIKFVTTQSDSGTNTTTSTTTKTSQTVTVGNKVVALANNSESGNIVLSEVKSTSKANVITPKGTKPLSGVQSQSIINNSAGQLLMVPASYLQRTSTPKVPVPIRSSVTKTISSDAVVPQNETINLETNGMRPRKPCNCTKSQCLKLYCDCFANGEFCFMCNCMNCYNNLDNEEHRQRAIKNCLDRNPNAFRPKIGKSKDLGELPIRKHTKGCNCKRSGCLKNYCECYEAKIACSSNCKCIGCRNIEDTMDKKTVRPHNVEVVFGRSQNQHNNVAMPPENILQIRPKKVPNNKHALNHIGVIEATASCLFAVAGSLEANGESEEDIKGRVIEEFGKCLMDIVNTSRNKNVNSY